MRCLWAGEGLVVGQWLRRGRLESPDALILNELGQPGAGDAVVAQVLIGRTVMLVAGVLDDAGRLVPAVPGMRRLHPVGTWLVHAFVWEAAAFRGLPPAGQ